MLVKRKNGEIIWNIHLIRLGFCGESANGAEDIWWILEGQDYPRLTWELVEE